ncbi:hypothetical protein DFH11DRAFT_1696800 [Phellopilus nigrolimitatus]|nr:hypothetical protein DFH11DRAFT_1696800 [Phellopilus nigrolimitatus]
MFNVVLLVTCIAIALGSVLYIFFWNRSFGLLLGLLFRFALWSQNSSAVWVDFGSVHISLLAGRMLLRDVRYHSSNQTFRIVKCQVSWRWWIRNVAEEEDLTDSHSKSEESMSGRKSASLCRIHISVEGFEWFMYNRTASFDAILSQLVSSDPAIAGLRSRSHESNIPSLNQSVLNRDRTFSRATFYSTSRRALSVIWFPSLFNSLADWMKRQLPDLNPRNLLPLSLDVVKGAITMGNHTTENLFMVEFAQAMGTYGNVQSRSKLDFYKQLFRVSLRDAAISCVENNDYWDNNRHIGKKVQECFTKTEAIFSHLTLPLSFHSFVKLWARCRTHFPYFKSRGSRYGKLEKEQKRNEREKKAREEASHIGEDFTVLEYAIDRKLFEAPVLELTYYADNAGFVPTGINASASPNLNAHKNDASTKGLELLDIGNGDLPPEWGVEVIVHGGAVHYGPWADRQRAQLQRVFFPQAFHQAAPTEPLGPGDQRCCTCLKLFVELRGVTTMHVPFREASKNWQWDGLTNALRDRKQRESASIQFRIGDKSSVKYLVPMVATAEGYTAELDIVLDNISVTSSLNDIRLLEANSCSIFSYLPSPLRWDSERSWNFDIELDRPVLFLIRDHINMIADLSKDWSAGPPSDFNTFVPITYSLYLTLSNFELNLYANDHNIIDRPLERRENTLFTFRGERLKGDAFIPSNKFRPLSSTVSFSIFTPNVALGLTFPRWNTHALSASAAEQLTDIGRVAAFHLSGSYTYFAEVREDCVDQLKLDIKIPSPALKLFGWIVRYVMVLRENYFGGFTQYSTTREYLERHEKGKGVGDPLELKYRPGKNNVFHFDLALVVEKGTIAVPAGLPGFESGRTSEAIKTQGIDLGPCLVIAIPEIQIMLRLHDYMMELSLNIDPIFVSIEEYCPDGLLLSHIFVPSKRQLLVSGLEITANRLFGPQPHAAAYVCMWTIQVGKVKGFLTTAEGQILSLAGKSFAHGFNDPFNAPASNFAGEADRDATFLKVGVDMIDITWQIAPAAIRLCLPVGLQLMFNNMARMHYRKMTSVAIPVIELQMLVATNANTHWLEVGKMQSSMFADLYRAPKGWRQDAEEQKRFLEIQDGPTRRFASMSSTDGPLDSSRLRNTPLYIQSLSLPRVLSPLSKEKLDQQPVESSYRRQSVNQRKFDESESDEERMISETVRDKRLADSRPNSFSVVPDGMGDEHSSSPFDESDETDGADSEDSWSDYFEIGEDRTSADSRARYRRFCRKFQLQHDSKEFDCQSTFVAGKEIPILQQAWPQNKAHGQYGPLLSDCGSRSANNIDRTRWTETDNVDKNYTCLDIKNTVIFLTPLIVSSLEELLTGHDADRNLSPELQLDILMLDWITASTEISLSAYDIRLRDIHVRAIQEVADLMKVPSFSQGTNPASIGAQTVSVMDLEVEGDQFLFSMPSSDMSLPSGLHAPCGKISIRKVSMVLSAVALSSMSNNQLSYSPTIAAELNVTSFAGEFTGSKLQTSFDGSELRLNRTAPDVVLASAGALHILIKNVLNARKKNISTLSERQQLVRSILDHTCDVPSKDLLSAVQPVFFVQVGRPQRLREDSAWKLLFHLRHSLSEISDERYKLLKQDLRSISKETELNSLVPKRQVPWAIEEDLPVMDVDLLQTLFSRLTKNKDPMERNNDQPMKSVGFRAGTLRLVLDDGDVPSCSCFTISGISCLAILLKRRLLFEANTMSPYSSIVRSFKPSGEYIDHGSISAVISLAIDSAQIAVYPGIIAFLQNAIHVWRILSSPAEPAAEMPEQSVEAGSLLGSFLDDRVVVCDVRVILHRMLIEVAAENVVFEVASQRFSSCTSGHISKPLATPTRLDISVQHTMRFDEFSARARTRVFNEMKYRENDSLAGVTVLGGLSCSLFQNHTSQGPISRNTFHIDSVELSVPRSGIRLYHFVEQWRQDYLLGIDAMIQSLFSEIRQTPKRPPLQTPTKKGRGTLVDLNFSVSNVAVILQVMHGTWLSWSAHGVVAYTKNRLVGRNITHTGGIHITSQSIKITSTGSFRPGDSTGQRTPKIVLDLPSLSASGSFSDEETDLLVSVGFLHATIKPSHWDALLSVQQKFGQDFNDLLLIIGETRDKHPSPTPSKPSSRNPASFTVAGKFDGFKIGLEGLSSTQYLECVDIDATVSSAGSLQWQFTLSDLALYLSPRIFAKQKRTNRDRSQLPILVSVDLQVTNYRTSSEESQGRLELAVTKFHAILQANMMGDIGDFIDHLQAEVLLRKEQRALELSDFKEKARKVMKTFNMDPRTSSLAKKGGFLETYTVAISMSNFGAAFPLDLDRKRMPKFGTDEEISTKAFLLCIKSLSFQTQRGKSGEALMTGFCFQFVSRFNPSNPKDFSADRHHTLNKMLYPEMTARLRSETTLSTRHVSVSARINGFVLDFDPSISGYVFSLVDAYRQGKQRVERLTLGLPRNAPNVDLITPLSKQDSGHGDRQSTILTTSIEAYLKFMSGVVRLHPMSKDTSTFSSISPVWRGESYRILDSDAEILKLPELSVWCNYHTNSGVAGTSSSEEDLSSPVLVFRSTVHSSHNTLRPTLLPFITGIVHSVEERMKNVSHGTLRPSSSSILSTTTVDESSPDAGRSQQPVSSNLQLIFTLRIDKSRLELTCKPDVNVVAGLHWDSGGFVLNISPGGQGVSVSASIDGITANLKHGFLSEASARMDAKNLNFSVNFAKASLRCGKVINSVSAVVDTEFSGSIRFSRLQDFLCFKAVWLDHIPVFLGDAAESTNSPSKLSTVSSLDQAPKHGFDTAVVIRIRQISLEADLGQSISIVTFELQKALIRTRLKTEYSELSVSFARVDMQARGNLSGHLRMPDFLFRTVRRRQGPHLDGQALTRMLELTLTSGTLDIQLQSDWLWLLQYRAEPLEAIIYDDWPSITPSTSQKGRQLQLYFSVSGSKVIAMMTIMAMPKLMMYAGKFRANMEAQQEGASRESSAFRSTRLPKPENALSEVANAMFQSARTKLKETESLSYVIGQHMMLKLEELVFVLLPRSQGDNELARFIGRNVMAQLERTVQQDGFPIHRDLRLSLSHMSISQLLKQGFDPHLPGQEFDMLTTSGRSLAATENVIFSLPAMDMHMITDEEGKGSRVLPYDFVSDFVRREGQKGTENINISFNISLYSWLTILRKTFTRELKRAQEIAEWRAGGVSPPFTTAPRFGSSDAPTSPPAFGSDRYQSPPQSRPSSRPASPIRSRSGDSAILVSPSKTYSSKSPGMLPSPKYGSPDSSKNPDHGGPGVPLIRTPSDSGKGTDKLGSSEAPVKKPLEITYVARTRRIERLTVRQLGEATPDVMHPFFTRRAGFNLEESLPQYVHEYATLPIEEIMKALVKLYGKQLS